MFDLAWQKTPFKPVKPSDLKKQQEAEEKAKAEAAKAEEEKNKPALKKSISFIDEKPKTFNNFDEDGKSWYKVSYINIVS